MYFINLMLADERFSGDSNIFHLSIVICFYYYYHYLSPCLIIYIFCITFVMFSLEGRPQFAS